eukprot:UN14804
MESLNNRAKESYRSCTDDSTTQWTVPLPSILEDFVTELYCTEELTGQEAEGTSALWFGKDSENAYLVEIQDYGGSSGGSTPPSMAVIASISLDSTTVHIWEIHTTYTDDTSEDYR